jgi:hypothetical protein
MPCKGNCENHEVVVCNSVFKYNLVPVDANTHVVCVSRCSTPTATFEIATIRTRTNTCSEGTYYQAAINGDPVEIIQDCSLCDIVRRAIEIYFNRLEPINCSGNGNGNCNCRNNSFLGLF